MSILTLTANHTGLAPTVIGFRTDLGANNFGTLVPATFVGLDGRTYTVQIFVDQGTTGDQLLVSVLYAGADPTQNSAFVSIQFTDKNAVPHTFPSASAVSFTSGGGASQWVFNQASGAMFANAGVYPITFNTTLPVPAPTGKGDIMNPNAWETVNTGKLPPSEYDGIPGGGAV